MVALSSVALAQDNLSGQEITAKDLGVENPGILPTSPFYFFKSITRNIKRVFTVDPVKKAELELNIANQQAAEIKKLEEVAPERVNAISRATANYQENVERLKTSLDNLRENSQNPNIDKLVEKLADQSIKHQQLFDELKSKFEDNDELKQRIESAQEKISETAAKIPEKFDNPEMFRERMEKILKARPEGVVNELKRIEIIDRIADKIPVEQREGIEAIKEGLMKEFGDKIEKLPEIQRGEILKPEFFEMIPGDAGQRVKILEEIKSKVGSLEIRGKIMEAGEKILENKIESREIKKEDVLRMMEYVKELIVKAEAAVAGIEDEEFRAKRKRLLEEIRTRFSKAEAVLDEGKIGEAFGIVNSAGAETKKFLIQPAVDAVRPIQEINIKPSIRPIESGTATSGPLTPSSNIMPIEPKETEQIQEKVQEIKPEIAPMIKNIIPEIPLMPKY